MTKEEASPSKGTGGAVAFALAAVSVLSVVVVWLVPGQGPLDGLPDPPRGPDRVPAGPIVKAVPPDCGVSSATVERLVDEARVTQDGGQGECAWTSGRDAGKDRRSLSVHVDLFPGGVAPTSYPATAGRSAIASAIVAFAPKWSDVAGKAVTGLGDEALVQSSPSVGTTIVARVGNAKATVRYSGLPASLSERTAQDGALAAAAEVVKGLGARTPPHPAIAAAARKAPARTIPDLCAAVSERTRKRLVDGDHVEPQAGEGGLGIKDAERRGCTWRSMERELTVSAAAMPGSELFDGTRLATREYVLRHDDARAEETLSVRDEKYFRAVAGLGDQAFAAHVPGVVPGTVVFRDGDLLVEVVYAEADERRPLSRKDAVRGAYAAAEEVAEALSAS